MALNFVTKIGIERERLAAKFVCGNIDCEVEFVYGPGFPEYCPECGEQFDATKDTSEFENRR